MSHHVANSSSVCIHSVCVSPDHRSKRVGVRLVREYILRLESATRDDDSKAYERALLITHEGLRDFYESAGFEWLGKSDVVHGSQPWFEMRKILGQLPDRSEPSMPPGLWDALQRPMRNRPAPRSLASFGGLEEVCNLDPEKSNKYDLLCPREECASVILKVTVAKLAERPSVQASIYYRILILNLTVNITDGTCRSARPQPPSHPAHSPRDSDVVAGHSHPHGI